MHTTEIVLRDGNLMTTYTILHNGDWSGNAHVSWQDGIRRREVTLPGEILIACGRKQAFADAIAAIETIEQ